jgi:hypothetical protein
MGFLIGSLLGFVVPIITFPGVIVHELAHQLFCRLARVAVFDVCYFRIGRPSGYVIHEPPRSAHQNILIDIGPFFVNTLLGALVSLPVAYPTWELSAEPSMGPLSSWLGVSIAMHAFPSVGDANQLWKSVVGGETSPALKIVVIPIVILIYLGAIASVFWLDVIYGVAVTVFLPNALVHALA